jgi:hypothetical protein
VTRTANILYLHRGRHASLWYLVFILVHVILFPKELSTDATVQIQKLAIYNSTGQLLNYWLVG